MKFSFSDFFFFALAFRTVSNENKTQTENSNISLAERWGKAIFRFSLSRSLSWDKINVWWWWAWNSLDCFLTLPAFVVIKFVCIMLAEAAFGKAYFRPESFLFTSAREMFIRLLSQSSFMAHAVFKWSVAADEVVNNLFSFHTHRDNAKLCWNVAWLRLIINLELGLMSCCHFKLVVTFH